MRIRHAASRRPGPGWRLSGWPLLRIGEQSKASRDHHRTGGRGREGGGPGGHDFTKVSRRFPDGSPENTQDAVLPTFTLTETGPGRFTVTDVTVLPTWMEYQPAARVVHLPQALASATVSAEQRAAYRRAAERIAGYVNQRGAQRSGLQLLHRSGERGPGLRRELRRTRPADVRQRSQEPRRYGRHSSTCSMRTPCAACRADHIARVIRMRGMSSARSPRAWRPVPLSA